MPGRVWGRGEGQAGFQLWLSRSSREDMIGDEGDSVTLATGWVDGAGVWQHHHGLYLKCRWDCR